MVFQGSCVAIVTPFLSDTEIDFESFGRLIDWQLSSGTDAICVIGTTGEPCTMSDREKEAAIAFAVDRIGGRVPVIAGTGGNCTAEVLALSKTAEKLGADALLIVTPYYNKATPKGLIAHYTTIADAVDIPIIMYNVPPRTGLNMLPPTVAALACHPNIAGVKEASNSIAQVSEIVRLCADEEFAVYSGEDAIVLPTMAVGGYGVISVAANIIPKAVHDMAAYFLRGDIEQARLLQLGMLPLVDALFCEVNPIPVKTALGLMGRCPGTLRLPLTQMEDSARAKLVRAMTDYGLLPQ